MVKKIAAQISQRTINGTVAPKIDTSKNIKLERKIANGSIIELIEESIPEAEIGKERETIIRLISLLHFIN